MRPFDRCLYIFLYAFVASALLFVVPSCAFFFFLLTSFYTWLYGWVGREAGRYVAFARVKSSPLPFFVLIELYRCVSTLAECRSPLPIGIVCDEHGAREEDETS